MSMQAQQRWMSPEAADQWRQSAGRRAEMLGPATERLLEAAQLSAGDRVLDLAAGSGDTSLLVARAVGPSGAVLAVDISEAMLAAATQAAREAGLSNISTRVADMATLDLEPGAFDAAISRLGLMFLDDAPTTLGRIRQALKPGSRLAALVWSTLERNVYFGIPLDAATEVGYPQAGEGSTRRAFSLADPAALTGAFESGGFLDVHVEAIPAPRRFGSVEEALSMLRAGPIASEMIELMSTAEVEQVWRGVKRRLESLAGHAGGLDLSGEVLLAVGSR